MGTQAEMDAALDNLFGPEDGDDKPGVVNEVVEEVIEEVIEEVVNEVIEDDPKPPEDEVVEASPPGFMSHQEWIDAGKDPKKFRGEDAYTAEFDRIQEIKTFRGEISGLKDTLSHVSSGMDEWRQQQTNTIRAEATAELEAATADDNVPDALAAQDKLNKLNAKPVQQTPQEPPLIQEFRRNNPMTDSSSPRFNAVYNEDVTAIFNNAANGLRDARGNITDDQMARCLTAATKQAKTLHPDLFESPRNKRTSGNPKPTRQTKVTKTENYRDRLKGVGNARNQNDSKAAIEMYDHIKDKGGEEAAERFAKATLGEA